jgi:hypothetical protein
MFSDRYDDFNQRRTQGLAAAPVVDGRLAPVTCAACGCRLDARDAEGTWVHFEGARAGTDARGCRVSCVNLPHRLN